MFWGEAKRHFTSAVTYIDCTKDDSTAVNCSFASPPSNKTKNKTPEKIITNSFDLDRALIERVLSSAYFHQA